MNKRSSLGTIENRGEKRAIIPGDFEKKVGNFSRARSGDPRPTRAAAGWAGAAGWRTTADLDEAGLRPTSMLAALGHRPTRSAAGSGGGGGHRGFLWCGWHRNG